MAYFYDSDIGNYEYASGHPMKPHRMRMVHSLINAYGLNRHLRILRPTPATPLDMSRYHTDEYVQFLYSVTPQNYLEKAHDRYNVGEDCPVFDGLFEFCSLSAGGSIDSARQINSKESDIVVNWSGGLHHAKRNEASGFCYVNDIVLCILELLRYHQHVLAWID